MKKHMRINALIFVVGLLLPTSASFADDQDTISGRVGVTVQGVDGERESSKFEEYREIPDGLTGDAEIRFQKENGYYLDFMATGIAEEDQNLIFRSGWHGKYRIEFIYDELPHRFAFGARTLYSGVGSGNLVLSDSLQTDLQGSASSADSVARLKSYFTGSSQTDLQLFRKTGKMNIDVMAFDPINFRVELSREDREGTRPFAGSFGFSNTVEIPEPIDYNTTQLKTIVEFSKRPVYLNATYYLSIFDNNIDTLTWDNPFRVDDATSATAYIASYADGPSTGLTDLYPNNTYNNVSLTGSIMDLPLKSRVTAAASWGWMRQDDDLVAYTSNTAIVAPFDATDKANLPTRKVDAKVNTTLYNVKLTSRPLDFMRVSGKYRLYRYDNDTELIKFPGHVRMDATWESGGETIVPTSYTKSTTGADVAFDLYKATTLTLGYTLEKTKRANREVGDQDEDFYTASFDTKPLSWLDFRVSYERSKREGHYDFAIPFVATHIGEGGEPPVPQLPFLRKYDESDRTRDRIQLMATLYPVDSVTVSGMMIYGMDDFRDSHFGLVEDTHQIYSIDADYALNDRLGLYAFYTYEKYMNTQKARQWSPSASCIIDADTTSGECTDPFTAVTGFDSPSNWTAENEDASNTLGGGFKVSVMPKKVDVNLSYSYSKTDGTIRLSSPVGANIDVDPNNFVPVDFTEVDDTTIQTLHAKVRYRVKSNFMIAVGYMWEKFDVKDFNKNGFTHIPTTATGSYNAALMMGALPVDYNATVVYTKLVYLF